MKRKKKNITTGEFIVGFFVIVGLLALIRLVFPSVVGERYSDEAEKTTETEVEGEDTDSLGTGKRQQAGIVKGTPISFYNADGSLVKHPVKGVWSYKDCFPDTNAVHLSAAKEFGVVPVANSADAEERRHELVYIGSSPYYRIAKLNSSIPYLVPRAAALLQDISRNFMDSLAIKRVPETKLLITSVLRSKEDVVKLGKHNKNASPNSCHVYGTTFDISYNHFVPLGRKVQGDTLKRVLSEVLNDLRQQNRCYVKYELHQACYHVTVR